MATELDPDPPAVSAMVETLLALTTTLLEAPTLDEALQAVTMAAVRLLPCQHASLRILDESKSVLLPGARSGVGTMDPPAVFREGEGIMGWVARHGRAARVHDAMTDERFKESIAQGFAVRSLLCVPLMAEGEAIGVLGATSSNVRVFSAEHEALAMVLANCAVPALQRARLERLAMADRETKAANLAAFIPRLQEEVGRARRHDLPLSLLHLHVDDLSPSALLPFAESVRKSLRITDVLFRVVGLEFAVMLPHTGAEQAKAVAERLRAALCEADATQAALCVGVATWDGTESAGQLQERAAAALLAAHSDKVTEPAGPGEPGAED